MSVSGKGVPKVTVSRENDMRLRPAGKMCAPAGLPNLPGGLMRAHSQPQMVLTCPGGWFHHHQEHKASLGREFRDRQRATLSHNGNVVNGIAGDATASLRPASSTAALPGGGKKQGVRQLQLSAEKDLLAEYDARRHGWPDPRAQAERNRQADPTQPGSWSWQIGKATNHNGYGIDGRVDKSDIQITAVSGDAPGWFTGTRDLPGPYGTRKNPVRRHPQVTIEGREVKVRAKTYLIGNDMTTIEQRHDRPTPPTPVQQNRYSYKTDHRGEQCHLEMGGCQFKQ